MQKKKRSFNFKTSNSYGMIIMDCTTNYLKKKKRFFQGYLQCRILVIVACWAVAWLQCMRYLSVVIQWFHSVEKRVFCFEDSR